MLTKVGLLPAGNDALVNFAYMTYTRTDPAADEAAADFKQDFCRSVKVEFLGAWDTVSMGLIRDKTLPYVKANDGIRTFRHALALDERRANFEPVLYDVSKASLGGDDKNLASQHPGGDSKPDRKGKKVEVTTDVKQVWFAGCHGDVGGGSLLEDDGRCLANVPLRWMIREVKDSGCGILFDSAEEERLLLPSKPDTSTTSDGGSSSLENDGESKNTTSLSLLDQNDCMGQMHDEFVAKQPRVWYFKRREAKDIARVIPKDSTIHESVRYRMEKTKYIPRAKYRDETEVIIERSSLSAPP